MTREEARLLKKLLVSYGIETLVLDESDPDVGVTNFYIVYVKLGEHWYDIADCDTERPKGKEAVFG